MDIVKLFEENEVKNYSIITMIVDNVLSKNDKPIMFLNGFVCRSKKICEGSVMVTDYAFDEWQDKIGYGDVVTLRGSLNMWGGSTMMVCDDNRKIKFHGVLSRLPELGSYDLHEFLQQIK